MHHLEEVARWLWEAGVFEPREDDTRRAELPPARPPRLRRRLWVAGTAAAAGLLAWALFTLRPEAIALALALGELPGWLP